MDVESKYGAAPEINFPSGFSDLVLNKLSRAHKKLPCVKSVIEKIEQNDSNVDFVNILCIHLLAYFFNCSTDSKGTKLTKVEIADHLLQIKEVTT